MLGTCVPAHRNTARERSYPNGSYVLNLGRLGDVYMNLQLDDNYRSFPEVHVILI